MRAAILIAIICASTAAHAQDASDWLAGLYDTWAPRVERGEPIVVTAHVPLCDNRIIRCGNKRLGDGDNPDTNLYWNTDEGFLGWFNRRGSGWDRVKIKDSGAPSDVLETRVWHRTLKPQEAWKDRAVDKKIE